MHKLSKIGPVNTYLNWWIQRDLARKAEWAADRPRRDAIEAQQRIDHPYGRRPRGF